LAKMGTGSTLYAGQTRNLEVEMSVARRKASAKRALMRDLTLSVEDAAVLLSLSRNGAYDAIKEGQIPHFKIGRSIRIPSAALRSMLQIEGSSPEAA
jgi:excisionase family DNA binding protein